MDEVAESGLASHWSYKGIRKEATLDSWLNSVRSVLERKSTLNEFYDARQERTVNDDVFVFTPSGELRKLPAGASVLDFAFEIHTNVGIKCVGGLVNGRSVPIREKLHTGDYVEILKGKNQKPSADWLNYVVSSKARNKIRQFIKEEEYQKANEGKELLASKCRKWKLEIMDEDLAALMKKYRLKTLNSLYEAIGNLTLDPLEVKKFVELRREVHHVDIQGSLNVEDQSSPKESNARESDVLIVDASNVKQLDYKFAKCCQPVFGDDIFGFVTRLDGIKIHKISCPNAARLLDEYPYRILKTRWSK